MLILTRATGEGIIIDTPSGSVHITFMDNPGYKSTKVGVRAPNNFEILRDELVFNRPKDETTGDNGNR